jgi:hypothetical protein
MAAPPWASQMVEVRARSGWATAVYEPLIRHRWPLYARDPPGALDKLHHLPPSTIQAILEHLYADTPIARTNLPAFKNCKIVEAIPFASTYLRDMGAFLGDAATADFALLPRDGGPAVRAHRFMLQARSHFFRAQFAAQPALAELRDPDMGRPALAVFAAYLYTGRLEPAGAAACVDLFGAGERYAMRDPGEIDFLAFRALARVLTPADAPAVRARAAERGLQKVLDLVDGRFPP